MKNSPYNIASTALYLCGSFILGGVFIVNKTIAIIGITAIGIIIVAKHLLSSEEKVVIPELQKPNWRAQMHITNENYVPYIDQYSIIRDTDTLGGASRKYYSKYIDYIAPNGKPIRILAQDKVTDSQVLYAYSLLEFYLKNLGKDVANKMADNDAILVMPNGADRDGNTREKALIGQPQFQDETANVGSQWYMENDYTHRDSTYEEVFHLVHGFGIGMVTDQRMPGGAPELAQKIYVAQQNAVPTDRKLWGKEGLWLLGMDEDSLTEWENEPGTLESEYIISVIDAYYGNWEAFDGGGALFGEYIAKTRDEVAEKDPMGYELITSFLPEYINTFIPVDTNFTGTFNMNYDSTQPYTFKSQYLQHLILQGQNAVNIIGNEQDNIFMGNAGINKIDGGKGKNVVQLRGMSSEYSITTNDGVVTVRDTVANRDGELILTNIQTLRFIDKDITQH